MRFVAAGMPSRVRELEAAGAVLCKRVYDDLLPMLDAAAAGFGSCSGASRPQTFRAVRKNAGFAVCDPSR